MELQRPLSAFSSIKGDAAKLCAGNRTICIDGGIVILPAGIATCHGLPSLWLSRPLCRGQTPLPYAHTISKWFDRERGLALGIGLAGVGLGVVLVPELTGFLIRSYGWRMGYVWLGLIIFMFAFVPVFLRLCVARVRAIETTADTAETCTSASEWRARCAPGIN
jgi:MFS family permease